MKKEILLLLLLLLNASCGPSSSSNEENEQYFTGIHSVNDPLPNEALTFGASIAFINLTNTQQDKMLRAIEIIKKVVATEEFREKVLNHTYKGVKTYIDNGGYNNSQIYQKILDAAEALTPYKNNYMDAEVELYYASTNVIGYTYPNTQRIWINTKYFDVYTPAGIAHNLFHEWMHKLGFGHAQSWSESRDYSVPYALGNLVGEIGKKFL